MNNIRELLTNLKITPQNEGLFVEAFTHSSVKVDHDVPSYERLEFLGDAFIGAIVASLIYKHYPDLDEGHMSKMRSEIVQTKSLAKIAKKFNFGEYITFGQSINKKEALINIRFYEDVFEAFIGALYLDQGYEFTEKFLSKIFTPLIDNFDFSLVTNYKNELQEAIQAEKRETVHYVLVSQTGPTHDQTFTVDVYLEDIRLGTGTGKTKKAAEQAAAKEALEKKAI